MVTRKLPDAVNLDAYSSIGPQTEQADWESAQSYPQEFDEREQVRPGWGRRASLEPEFLADPPRDIRRSSLAASLFRMAVVAALVTGAGFAAYTYLDLEAYQQDAGIGTSGARSPAVAQDRGFEQRAALPLPRLNIEGSRSPLGQPAPLGVSLQGAVPSDATVVVAGLPEDATVSAGERFGANAWLVPAARLAGATVRPHPNFAGAADLVVEVVMPDGATADRGIVRLEWLAPPPAAVSAAAVQPPAAPPVMAAAPASPAVAPDARPQAPPAAAAPPSRTLAQDEIAMLLKRAEAFLNARDVSAARVMLRRAAEARSPEGAYALAATYDPAVLRSLGVIGIQGEPETARLWYERAAQYGSADARSRLNEIAQASR